MAKYLDRLLISLLSLCIVACFLWSIDTPQGKEETTTGQIHFLIPGGAGGGWDSTARGVGEALTKSGLCSSVSFENMSGGGGGKAIAHLVETAGRQRQTLLVNSLPIVIRSLQGVFPQSFRELTPVASVIGDYGAFVVPLDSKYRNWRAVVEDFEENPRRIKVAGGSVRGSMDHLVAALAFKAAGGDPREVVYVPYDAGGKAMAGLLSGEPQVLSTGLSEALEMQKVGQLRILAITAEERLATVPDVPTLKELGYDVSFVNWRGFFAAPGTSSEKIAQYNELFQKMYRTEAWQTIRSRNGWVDIYKPGPDEFFRFLETQERELGQMMRELGFLE